MAVSDWIGRLTETLAGMVQDEQIAKATSSDLPEYAPEEPTDSPKGMLWDPFSMLETLGYRERYSMVSYDALQRLAYKVPVFPPILQIRTKQIQLFSVPQHDENEAGFSLRMRDRDKTPGKKERNQCRDIEEWLSNTGSSSAIEKDGFGQYLQKITKDSLIYDQAATEKVYNRKGLPADFYAMDGSTIRIVDQPWDRDIRKSDDQIKYVQVHDSSVIAEFTPRELAFMVRNPRTDLRCNGYGVSELEMAVNLATSLIFGYQYNTKFFSQGTVAKGMLNLPKVPDKRLGLFARQWHLIVSGIDSAWRTPITNFPEAEWIDLQKGNRDMEYSAWMDFLIKLFAATCLIDPTEFNMTFGNQGQTGQMFQSGSENKVKHSKDKGLRPLLISVAEHLNRHLIWPINRDLELYFTGLDPKEAGEEIENQKKKVSYLMTVDEMRKENDLPPLPDGKGEVILDPTWNQAAQMKEQMSQQEQMGQEQDQGGQEPQEQQEGGQEQPEDGPDAWGRLLAQKSLTKAVVTERKEGDVIHYEIEV